MNHMNSHSPHFQKKLNKNSKRKKKEEKTKYILRKEETLLFCECGEGNSSTNNGDTRRADTKHHKRIQRMVFETRRVVGIRAVD